MTPDEIRYKQWLASHAHVKSVELCPNEEALKEWAKEAYAECLLIETNPIVQQPVSGEIK